MNKVTARGKYFGSKITVDAFIDGGTLVILVDDEENPEIEKEFNEMIENQPPMAGTYYPEKDSLLAAFNVLSNVFFDELESINVEGDIGEIPFEEGQIY